MIFSSNFHKFDYPQTFEGVGSNVSTMGIAVDHRTLDFADLPPSISWVVIARSQLPYWREPQAMRTNVMNVAGLVLDLLLQVSSDFCLDFVLSAEDLHMAGFWDNNLLYISNCKLLYTTSTMAKHVHTLLPPSGKIITSTFVYVLTNDRGKAKEKVKGKAFIIDPCPNILYII